MKNQLITQAWLYQKGACALGVEEFRAAYPSDATTLAALLRRLGDPTVRSRINWVLMHAPDFYVKDQSGTVKLRRWWIKTYNTVPSRLFRGNSPQNAYCHLKTPKQVEAFIACFGLMAPRSIPPKKAASKAKKKVRTSR